ncbi:PilZ domain-containing protein [Trichlorobacter ammonificans]|uniref:Type IV pilus assembly PilZ n=1 Tax=Trichlorobacter ammonificans TaxID=2916410 RepID=A0ABM9D8P8_9BACT|nr:PilZ domain-containing protein [Trichlorobacter ammonificans]CAH2030936.1 Type IV pilus assembly PilZ [Trichlorobacter ammonificans]
MHYDKYFGRGQKVFLINISDERDQEVYNSFTGQVLSCLDDRLTLKTPYRLFSGDTTAFRHGMQFKLTTESLGMGIQLRAELQEPPTPDSIVLKPVGDLSVYQRRQSPRADTTLPLLHVSQKSSLEAFRKEWRRISADLRQPNPPRLKMLETELNISVGGIRFDMTQEPTSLSLVVVDLQDGNPPVNAVAELIWQKRSQDNEKFQCGHRFIDILKEDQQRISQFIERLTGAKQPAGRQKELTDSM